MKDSRVKVAVVGSGISGLSAAWLLSNDKSKKFHVTLYEKNEKLGGHTNTVKYTPPSSFPNLQGSSARSVNVDTGFIVFNEVTYPNLVRLLNHLSVRYKLSDMSFSVSADAGKLEWAGTDLNGVFAQYWNIFNPHFVWMLLEIVRFNCTAPLFLQKHADSEISIGEYLTQHGYSDYFAQNYLVPMTAAIWSTAPNSCFSLFPAVTLFRFMHNHALLQLVDHHQWYTIDNGSQMYIDAMSPSIAEIRTGCKVTNIRRSKDGKVYIQDGKGYENEYDYVIVACHGDESYKMISDLTSQEESCLSKVKYSPNRAVLHNDESLMPLSRDAWTSWNYITLGDHSSGSKNDIMCLTYWMNKLQSIDSNLHGNIFVTMNPLWEPKEGSKVMEFSYHHPLYDKELITAQSEVKVLNKEALKTTHTLYCGAWTNYGFHEDGLTSGLNAAILLGAKCPFEVVDATHIRSQQITAPRTLLGTLSLIFEWFWTLLDALIVLVLRVWPHRADKIANGPSVTLYEFPDSASMDKKGK